MRKQTRLLTGALIASLLGVAGADPKIEEADVRIRYEEGMSMDELYRRIQSRANIACRSDMVLAHERVRHQRACETEFVAAAVSQFGLPELTALHEGRTSQRAERVAASK